MILFECRDSVTSNFPDGKFSRPRLAAFALYFAQTHASLRLSRPDESQAIGFLILSLRCSNAGTRTPIAGARNQCPTVRRHSIYIVYYTLYVISIQGVGVKIPLLNFISPHQELIALAIFSCSICL